MTKIGGSSPELSGSGKKKVWIEEVFYRETNPYREVDPFQDDMVSIDCRPNALDMTLPLPCIGSVSSMIRLVAHLRRRRQHLQKWTSKP